jgi:hypothetical protein
MSIIQISKIQQRSGDLVDLPQLDQAEFGFAADVNRLFIGRTSGNIENIEVLTAYSDIAFSQIDGATGNLNISNTVANGEVMVYDGNNWVNRGGNTGGYINLGEVSNVAIEGGAIGYILTTDGSGGLDWSPKGVVSQNITDISQANPGRLTLSQPYPFATGSEVTINGITGSGDFPSNLNGNQFYIKSVPGNLQLYDLYYDSGLSNAVNTSTYTPAYSDGGVLIFNTVSSNGEPGGSNGSVQFNSGAGFSGVSTFTFDYTTNTLTIPNIVAGANANSVGTIEGNWTLTSGSRLQSTYADLAEYYCSDANYAAGTVLAFGGEYEVTLACIETNKVAGVVSANPAYVMNGMIQCEHPIAIALQGRVPCKVKGKVYKGDMMISAGGGYAKAAITTPKIGTVIGKALANFDGEEGIIEVVVGRL